MGCFVVQLYKDAEKPLNEFEMRFQSTQHGLTLGSTAGVFFELLGGSDSWSYMYAVSGNKGGLWKF